MGRKRCWKGGRSSALSVFRGGHQWNRGFHVNPPNSIHEKDGLRARANNNEDNNEGKEREQLLLENMSQYFLVNKR